MNAYYEGMCHEHGKWMSRSLDGCAECRRRERLDTPLFVWIAPAGEELISMDGLVLSVTRPDGTMIMQFHLPKGMYKSIFVNHPDRTFHYSSDGVLS